MAGQIELRSKLPHPSLPPAEKKGLDWVYRYLCASCFLVNIVHSVVVVVGLKVHTLTVCVFDKRIRIALVY